MSYAHSMNQHEEDQRLKQLVLEAQQHPPNSVARRRALDKVIRIVMSSTRLYRPPVERIPPQCRGAYAEILKDAKQETMLYCCQNIERYDPDRASVIGWINMLLDRRFVVVGIRQFQDGREQRLGKRRRLQDLLHAEEDIPAPVNENPNYEVLRQFVIDDPEGLLQDKHIRGRADITFRFLLLQKLEDRTWDDIAQGFGIPLPTLHSFFRRSLRSLISYFQRYLKD